MFKFFSKSISFIIASNNDSFGNTRFTIFHPDSFPEDLFEEVVLGADAAALEGGAGIFGFNGVVVLGADAAALEGGAGIFGLRGVVVLGDDASALDGPGGPYDLKLIIYEPFVVVEFCGEFCNCLITSRLLSINTFFVSSDGISEPNLSPYGNGNI
jgi:hypothetical protein